MLERKVADVREKIKNLAVLEIEPAEALRNCDRELRSKRAVKHKDCCPLLSKLDGVGSANGNRRVSHGRRSGTNQNRVKEHSYRKHCGSRQRDCRFKLLPAAAAVSVCCRSGDYLSSSCAVPALLTGSFRAARCFRLLQVLAG